MKSHDHRNDDHRNDHDHDQGRNVAMAIAFMTSELIRDQFNLECSQEFADSLARYNQLFLKELT